MGDTQNKEQGTPNENLDPEEAKAEQEALNEKSDNDVRKEVIEKYNFDEEADKDLIDKITADVKEERKKTSTAIRQKIDWRGKAQGSKEQKAEEKPQKKEDTPQPTSEEQTRKIVQEEADKREIDSLEVSDELKEEIKTFAKVQGCSIKSALGSGYIQFKKKQEDEKKRADEASAGGSTAGQATQNLSEKSPEDIAQSKDLDMSTKEGQEEWERRKEHLKKTQP